MTDPFEWDAQRYGELPLPHVAWGEGVLARLAPSPGARVLEVGCGTGRDAARLLGARPDVRYLGVDGSEQMLAAAGEALAHFGDRVRLRRVDLREPQDFGPIDGALSVATLHWVPDHQPLFASVARALAPGGRFVVDAGGHGNLARLALAIESVFGAGDRTWNFATADGTSEALREQGFTVVDARLWPDPLVLPEEAHRPYLATVVLGAHLHRIAPQQRAAAVDAVAEAMGEPLVDYVRLEFEAVR